MQKQNHFTLVYAIALILVFSVMRIVTAALPGIFSSFSPSGTIALFSFPLFRKKSWAYLFVLPFLFTTDAIMSTLFFKTYSIFYPGWYWQYFSYFFIILLGSQCLKSASWPRVWISSLFGSFLFFVITNFGTWTTGLMYPLSFSGLMTCYTMGIPFYKTALLSNLLFSCIFYLSFQRFQFRHSRLQLRQNNN